MDHLVLSLGHNSSAILIENELVIGGYENERITGIKSDSQFPRHAIQELHNRHEIKQDVTIYVSHWELFGEVDKMSAKHWDPGFLKTMFPKCIIHSVNQYFTHHDAHAWSAVSFAADMPCDPSDGTYIIVADGFGTFGEHLSLYRYVDHIPVLLERKYGFGTSLGLLYQYTTSYIGLKMNQDEYKLLAFEAHIGELDSKITMPILYAMIRSQADLWIGRIGSYQEMNDKDPMLSLGALPQTAAQIATMLKDMLDVVVPKDVNLTEREVRIVVSYFVQSIVEEVMQWFLGLYKPKNLILVGGLFYNVKLNHMMATMVPGKTAIMPLAGDQGAGLGLYAAMHPDFKWPNQVFFGHRDLELQHFADIQGIEFYNEDQIDRARGRIIEVIRENGMVNIVRGAMEYGPRALCHTSTIGLPNKLVAEYVNRINMRTNEMPFAPVMTPAMAEDYLIDTDRIHDSLKYMICTREVRSNMVNVIPGAVHQVPNTGKFTARPQVTQDPFMIQILDEFGFPLINTSFNFHGVPIVWDSKQIRHSHMMETQQSADRPPTTIVIGD